MSIRRAKRKFDPKSKETQRFVAKKLDKFCKYLDSEYNINSGGCCYMAYLLARLLKRDGFRFKIVVWDYSFSETIGDKFTSLLQSHRHYGILLNGCFINEAGYHNDPFLEEIKFSNVRVIDILEHYKLCSWNAYYKKSQNSYISKMLEMFYDNLTKDLREK